MANCGNFIEFAGNKCGLDVGFGKLILIYSEKTTVPLEDLTADAINAAITAGTIVGVIKNWHTVVGAPVGETSVERVGTGEMKILREEIAADTYTFESTLQNREVLADLVKLGSLNCLLIDDQGSAFGDKSERGGCIDTMLLNFSGKTTSSLQLDVAVDKSIMVTVRYLVKNLDVLFAGIETELVASKALLELYLNSVTSITETGIVFVALVKDKATGKAYADAIATGEVSVTGANISSVSGVYVPATGLLTVTLVGTGFIVASQMLNVSVSGAGFYSKETQMNIKLGE